MDTLLRNINLAIRGLRRQPRFALAIVVVLALGIGANTAIFSVVDAVFLRPLPYESAGELVHISETSGGHTLPVSYPNFEDWRARAKSFQSMAAFVTFATLARIPSSPERIETTFVTAPFFETLRVKPALGRVFTTADDAPNSAPVVLLTHEIWMRNFAADPNVIGRTITIDKQACTVAGVRPATFQFVTPADVYAPMSLSLNRLGMRERGNRSNLMVLARRKPGIEVAQVQAEMTAIAGQLEREYPGINSGIGGAVKPLRERIAGGSRSALYMLMGAVAVLLLIACLNIGSLLLVRALSREKEIAIRAALGATRWQIAAQLLVESLVLSAAGGALGVALASLTTTTLSRLAPASIIGGPVVVNWRVFVFAAAVTVITGAFFGVIPVAHVFRSNWNTQIREGVRTTSTSGRVRAQNLLVTAEVALSVALLTGAGLLLRSFYNLMQVQPGYRSENVLGMRVTLPDSEEIRLAQYPVYFDRLLAYVRTLPGVEQAAGVAAMPFTGENSSMTFYLEGKPVPPKGQLPSAARHVATPEYFSMMAIPLLRGRIFDESDPHMPDFARQDAMKFFRGFPFTVVISNTMAKRFWPNEDPVGHRFRVGAPEFQGPWVKVIGVVGDTKHRSLDEPPSPAFYFPSFQMPSMAFNLVIRTPTEAAALMPAIRLEATRLHPDATITDVRTVAALIDRHVANRKMNLYLVAVFAGMALLLATVGVYGVIAYSVAQRTHELGVRLALGAGESRVIALVLRHGAALGLAGLLFGLATAATLSRFIATMLFGVGPFDVVTFGGVALVLSTVLMIATYVPARRAARIEPLSALRSE